MNVVYANNARWSNRSHTTIDLIVRFEEIGEEIPFTASPNDCEEHGRVIFARATAGEFGPVAQFQPVIFTPKQVSDAIKVERDHLLSQTDWTQLPDVPQQTKALWGAYRQTLRDIPQQAGFPWYDKTVVETDFGFEIDLSSVPWPIKPM